MKASISFALVSLIILVSLVFIGCAKQPPKEETPTPEVVPPAQEISEIATKAEIPDINKPLTRAKAIVLTKPEPELIPAELSEFFDQFDFDSNEEIDIEEASFFYYWVENNITYRYDDENKENPLLGSLVGDGRPGADYRQRPYETYIEGAGDCEDMATLEVAFLNYWGIAAYVAGVNADDLTYLD
ncbi:MAG: transglutaminase domain-containing protein, partial [Chloroflexi bacterium]|nr:transglutaminase domain-containing protein [Chloroflexota bacterium]